MNYRFALNRISYGIKQDELQKLESMGWTKWVDLQLSLQNDDECNTRISQLKYSLEFDDDKQKTVAIENYARSASELWGTIKNQENPPEHLYRRSHIETALVTWTKCIYSKNQLYELMVEFWHNHFNVSIEKQDTISLLLPVYDKDIIRKHTYGNFRTFLEAVATSPCMLYYLDNESSKASPANENYVRELFELHSLGAMHYYNHIYNDWKQVPGATEGKAEGYIDEDVYEAARAFTGWTVASGREEEDFKFPDTGAFYYYDQWHDHYQKRILGYEFKSHQDTMKDGHMVLDLVAYHPGTAKHLCTKLCTWLIGNEPPKAAIDAAIKTWTTNNKASDQIAKTIRTILLSKAFEQGLNNKVKRPNHLLFSFVRQLNLQVTPNTSWLWLLRNLGYKQFTWPLPTGHPDTNDYWINPDMLLKRWNSIVQLIYMQREAGDGLSFSKETILLSPFTPTTIINYWSQKFIGSDLDDVTLNKVKQKLVDNLGDIRDEDWKIMATNYAEDFEHKLIQLIGLLALMPEFQKR